MGGVRIAASTIQHLLTPFTASHLAPQLAGPDGIVPTRGQVVAVRPTQAVDCPQGLLANDGLEYALVRPLSEEAGAPPPIILGGGREKVASAEWGMTDDHTTAPEASQVGMDRSDGLAVC
jgi:hypothetical protein